MSALKLTFLFAALVLVISTPVYASNENTLRVENITSISSIVNPATLNLTKSVNAAPEWRNFIPPQAFWSPDGSKLLIRSSIRWYPDDVNFRPSNRNGIDAIYTLDADGTNLTKIVSNEINNRSTPIGLPAPLGYNPWSPSGDKIAIEAGAFYILADSDGDWLNVPDTNFSDMVSIVTNLSKIPQQRYLAWSPDGSSILFVSVTERRNLGIFVSDSKGRNVKLIYEENNPLERATLKAVSWSPDGNKIAFTVSENGIGLYTINSDGTGKTLLTSNLSWSWTNPYAWSPSGDKIAFSSSTANGEHIFTANSDGTERVQITTGENKRYVLSGMGGSWSPDGSRLLIESQSNLPSRDEVFIAKLSGYERTVSVRAPELIKQQKAERSPKTTDIAAPAPQITESTTSATPQAPGFDAILTIGILSTIHLFKRRYN